MEAVIAKRTIRPLPAIPHKLVDVQTSRPPSPCRPRPRPLPSPPSSSSSPSLPPIALAKSIPNDTRDIGCTKNPVAEQPRTLLPPRPILAMLAADCDSLHSTEDEDSSSVSSHSSAPLIPNRARMSKLRPHFAEVVYDNIVYANTRIPFGTYVTEKGRPFADLEVFEDVPYLVDGIMTDDESIDTESDKTEESAWSLGEDKTANAFSSRTIRQRSRAWMYEKRGQRREETDYQVILRALRSL